MCLIISSMPSCHLTWIAIGAFYSFCCGHFLLSFKKTKKEEEWNWLLLLNSFSMSIYIPCCFLAWLPWWVKWVHFRDLMYYSRGIYDLTLLMSCFLYVLNDHEILIFICSIIAHEYDYWWLINFSFIWGTHYLLHFHVVRSSMSEILRPKDVEQTCQDRGRGAQIGAQNCSGHMNICGRLCQPNIPSRETWLIEVMEETSPPHLVS